MNIFKLNDNQKYLAFLIFAAVIIWFVFSGEIRHFIGLFFAIAVMFFGVGRKLDEIHDEVKKLKK